jgi:hypothetical protein
MKTPSKIIYRKCACGISTPKGIQCARCDAVCYSVWAIENYHEDPKKRIKFVDYLRTEGIIHHSKMLETAVAQNKGGMASLARTIARHLHKFDWGTQIDIFRKATDAARWKADKQIAANVRMREEKEKAEAEDNQAAAAVHEVMQDLHQSGQLDKTTPGRHVDPERNTKAYSNFDPTVTDF